MISQKKKTPEPLICPNPECKSPKGRWVDSNELRCGVCGTLFHPPEHMRDQGMSKEDQQAYQASKENPEFSSKEINAGCPRCASGSYSLYENGKVSCPDCGKSYSRGVLEDWTFFVNSVIVKCFDNGWRLRDLSATRPPFFLGKIAKDRQDFLSGRKKIEQITSVTHCRKYLIRESQLANIDIQGVSGMLSRALYQTYDEPLVINDPDCTDITFHGKQHHLRTPQAAAIKLLVEKAAAGHPDVPKKDVGTAMKIFDSSDPRDSLWRSDLWKTLIVSHKKGTYRLSAYPKDFNKLPL